MTCGTSRASSITSSVHVVIQLAPAHVTDRVLRDAHVWLPLEARAVEIQDQPPGIGQRGHLRLHGARSDDPNHGVCPVVGDRDPGQVGKVVRSDGGPGPGGLEYEPAQKNALDRERPVGAAPDLRTPVWRANHWRVRVVGLVLSTNAATAGRHGADHTTITKEAILEINRRQYRISANKDQSYFVGGGNGGATLGPTGRSRRACLASEMLFSEGPPGAHDVQQRRAVTAVASCAPSALWVDGSASSGAVREPAALEPS